MKCDLSKEKWERGQRVIGMKWNDRIIIFFQIFESQREEVNEWEKLKLQQGVGQTEHV